MKRGTPPAPPSPATGSPPTAAASAAVVSDHAEKREDGPAWLALGLVAVAGVSLLLLRAVWGSDHGAVIILLLLALAALAVGGLAGFLFGIPRALSDDAAAPAGGAAGGSEAGAGGRRGPGYRPSNNLEQVSDWLTKIIIGVGLVEFTRLSGALATLGEVVASTSKPPAVGAGVMAQIAVVLFATLGFLASFLWTRIYYGQIQTRVDRGIWSFLSQVTQNISQQGSDTAEVKNLVGLLATGELNPGAAAAPAPAVAALSAIADPELAELLKRFRESPVEWDSDPAGDLFGNAPAEKDGRRLEAQITASTNSSLVVTARVVRTGGAPLAGTVRFLLHPTLAQSERSVVARQDRAEISFSTGGWFTVAALVDGGRTILSYSLKQLPGAPEWFLED